MEEEEDDEEVEEDETRKTFPKLPFPMTRMSLKSWIDGGLPDKPAENDPAELQDVERPPPATPPTEVRRRKRPLREREGHIIGDLQEIE